MKTSKILIVEDEPAVLQVLHHLLAAEGYEIVTAHNGEEALEKVYDPSGFPNLILADIMMPQMDGYEFCHHVRLEESTRSIPFIFVTAKTGHADRAKAYGLGVQRYITKPFTRDQVVGAVQVALADTTKLINLEAKLPLSGSLAAASVTFLIELFFHRRWKGRLKIAREGQEGVILFDHGDISAAFQGLLSGEEALGRMVAWEDGSFRIEREG